MQQLSIKRGDTLYAECQLVDEFGAGLSVSDISIVATLFDRADNAVVNFDVTKIDANVGKYTLSLATTDIAPSLYRLEITYTRSAHVYSNNACDFLITKTAVDNNRSAIFNSLLGTTKFVLTAE